MGLGLIGRGEGRVRRVHIDRLFFGLGELIVFRKGFKSTGFLGGVATRAKEVYRVSRGLNGLGLDGEGYLL